MTPNRARLSNITRNVLNMHEAMGAQHERIAKLEKQLEAMHAQMQTTTPKRKYTTIQDSSPEDSSTIQDSSPVDGAEAPVIFCPSDVQELIEEMFQEHADIFRFVPTNHEAETNRYYAKKQCYNAKPAQPTAAAMLDRVADNL